MDNDDIEIVDEAGSNSEIPTPSFGIQDIVKEDTSKQDISSVDDILNSLKEESKETVPTAEVAPVQEATPAVPLQEEVTPVQDVPQEVTPTVENTTPVDDNSVAIKQTSTLKNEAGTMVIGEVGNDGVKAINNSLPTSIDISNDELPSQKEDRREKRRRIKIQTKRDKRRTLISIILFIVVLLAGGGSAYYFLYIDNDNLFEAKNVTFELDQELPKSATYYVDSKKKINDMEYEIDLSSVSKAVGTYSYIVKHNKITKTGLVTIKDTKGPVITLKEKLKFSKDSDIRKEDIVESCVDQSNCTYDLEDKIDSSNVGNQDIVITAKDNVGNETKTNATIEIFEVAKTVVCINEDKESSDKKYKEHSEDTIYFDNYNNLIYVQGKKVVTYNDFMEYFDLQNKEKDNSDYVFDGANFAYSTFNKSLYDKDTGLYDEVMNVYKDKGYTCK